MTRWVVCVENRGYEASLERRKLYERVEDSQAEARGFIRVRDESGEDYLYPARMFDAVDVAPTLEARLLHAA